MSSGVFCKTGSSTDVHNSILIDEYHKCIFGDSETVVEQENMKNSKADADTSTKTTEEQSTWKVGMDVRAKYGFESNAQYYEGKLKKIFDNEYALVEFYGYSGVQVAKIHELQQSDGQEAIKDQIAIAEGSWEDDCEEERGEEEEEEEESEEIDWEIDMPCRAYYKPTSAIYEATILSVDYDTRTAFVSMLGYGIDFTVSFDDLYRSDPALREKQKVSSKKYMEGGNSESGSGGSPYITFSYVFPQRKSDSEHHLPLTGALKPSDNPHSRLAPNRPSKSGPHAFDSRPSQSNCAPDPAFQHNQNRNIMLPKNENEALACLLSANYLSGYYAGFYDCLHKGPKTNQQDASKDGAMYAQMHPRL